MNTLRIKQEKIDEFVKEADKLSENLQRILVASGETLAPK